MSKRYRKKITDKQADYVLALKKNQSSLYEDIELYFRVLNDRNGDIDVYDNVEKMVAELKHVNVTKRIKLIG